MPLSTRRSSTWGTPLDLVGNKIRYGLVRTRLMGLAKNLTLFGLTAIAHNIQKGAKFLRIYGLPEPACAK
jgi:hypothetical protein